MIDLIIANLMSVTESLLWLSVNLKGGYIIVEGWNLNLYLKKKNHQIYVKTSQFMLCWNYEGFYISPS